MRETLKRGAVTDAMLTHLRLQALVPIGDAETPDDGGWTGNPGRSGVVFRPFQVLVPGPASVAEGSLENAEQDWKLPYVITTFGIGRSNTETVADEVRQHLVEWPDAMVGGWQVRHVTVAALGPVVRHEGIEPKIYSQTDTVMVWITKEY